MCSVSDDPTSTTQTSDLDEESLTTALTSTTNLQFVRSGNLGLLTPAWFVVQFANVVNLIDLWEIFP